MSDRKSIKMTQKPPIGDTSYVENASKPERMSVTEYVENDSKRHRLDIRWKLISFSSAQNNF